MRVFHIPERRIGLRKADLSTPWLDGHASPEDRALVGMLVEGRFDSLMFQPKLQTKEKHEYLRGWVAKLRAASQQVG